MGAVCMGCAAGQRVVCALEGGSSCRHENWLLQTDGSNAFKGMHCSWVGEHCLAMQRPSTRINSEHGIPAAFAASGIKAVICLQEVGEHQHCGDGIHAANGLSYMPEEFMKEGVSFYHFPWRDMDTPDIDTGMRIAQVMTHHVDSGDKVAVHCHAGLGRTGLVIACWLVLGGIVSSAAAAVTYVRKYRRGALQTRKQVRFVHEFEEALFRAWDVFGHSSGVVSTENAVLLQRWALHGRIRQRLGHVPRLLAEAATLWKAALAAPTALAAPAPDASPGTSSSLIEFYDGILSLLSLVGSAAPAVAAPACPSEPSLPGAVVDEPRPLAAEHPAAVSSPAKGPSGVNGQATWNESTRNSILVLLKVGKTPTRSARAISCCIRSLIDAVAPPPALLQSLQLLFAICISGGGIVSKVNSIQAVVQMGIQSFRNGVAVTAQPDAAVIGDFGAAFGFLFPTEQ